MKGRAARFVEFYLGTCGGNATAAAIKAGYSAVGASQAAWRLLQEPRVKEAIRAELAGLGITRERVLLRLAEVAFADVGEFLAVDRRGEVSLRVVRREQDGKKKGGDGNEVAQEAGEEAGEGEGDRASELQEVGWRIAGRTNLLRSITFSRTHGVRIEMQDQQRALVLLGRYLGMWEGEEMEGGDGFGELARGILRAARVARFGSDAKQKGEEGVSDV